MNSELRLADDLGLGGRTGAAAEVHAQIAVPMTVPAFTQRVRRINGRTRDQGADRRYDDKVTEASAQKIDSLFCKYQH